jgi:hypothetical protein
VICATSQAQFIGKKQLEKPSVKAPVACKLKMWDEKFHSTSRGLLAFLPFISSYGIDRAINSSAYPFEK